MKALSKRIARLEQAVPDDGSPALIIVHLAGRDQETIVAVDNVDLHREADESTSAFLSRLAVRVRAERGRVGPLITFAVYSGDDAPDGPPEPDATTVMLCSTVHPDSERGAISQAE